MKLDWLKNSTKAKFICLTAITAILYAFVTLLLFGFDRGSSFWISLVFAIGGICLAGLISFQSVCAARRLTDWIFSLPVLRWCVIYAAAEVILATVYMIFTAPWEMVFLTQFLLPILFLILVVPSFLQKNHVATINQQTAVKVSYIRQIYLKLTALLPRAEDSSVKKELEKAIDLLRHSDPMSADSLFELEQKISKCVEELDVLVRESDWNKAILATKELCMLASERNQLVIAAKITQY